MSSRKSVLGSAAVAVILALAVLVGGTIAGVIPGSGVITGSKGPPNSGGNGTLLATGTISIVATDPPQVPDGVTSMLVTYSSVAVHMASADSQAGWVELNASGTFDSLKLINSTETIASANVPSGLYDMVQVQLSSVTATLNGITYLADVPSNVINATIGGGVEVNGSQPAAALVDFTPTLLNSGTTAAPHLVLNAACEVFALSPSETAVNMSEVGSMSNLTTTPWWPVLQENHTASIEITGATITTSSLMVAVKNDGALNETLRFVIATPLNASVLPTVQPSKGYSPVYSMPPMGGSYVFAVLPNGTLSLVSSSVMMVGTSAVSPVLMGKGYNLSAGRSATLSYAGPLILGTGGSSMPMEPSSGEYQVTLIGDLAQASVVISTS